LLRGEVRPIRIMTGPPEPGDENEVLGERTAPEFTFSVRWRVHEKGFFELALNLPGGTDWKNKIFHVRKYMRDTAEGLLNLEVTSRSPVKVVAEQRQIGEKLKAALERAFSRYALEIEEVLLQSPDFGVGINHALARVIEARGEAKETRTKADGKSYETAKLSEGAATAAVNAAEAESTRLRVVSEGQKDADLNAAVGREAALAAEGTGRKRAAEALGMEGAHYMALEQAPEILGDKTVILGAEGVAQALGIGAAVQAATKPPASQKGGEAK
jgi:regulator of protease activity HflC (stomatin/prohibitin superfamily)